MVNPVQIEGLVAIILALGIPMVAVIMVFITAIKKSKHQKDVRKMIIENKTDPEVAKLLIEEPEKKKRKVGNVDLSSLRAACVLLGAGLGGVINLLIDYIGDKNGINAGGGIYFWLVIALGIGVGLLCAFLVEMHLYKKYSNNQPDSAREEQNPHK